MKLDLAAEGAPPVTPLPAATVVLLRDGEAGLEVFCVERSSKSSFLAGALVFPGGRLDPGDRDWSGEVESLGERARGWDHDGLRAEAYALAAVRETLEEAGILLARGTIDVAGLEPMRRALLAGGSLRDLLGQADLAPAVADLVPFARWITPTAETKRFDTMFFLARAPVDQPGAHDDGETVSSTWATPADLLERWQRAEISMVPPTHATLEWLLERPTVETALADAGSVSLAPICPELARQDDAPALLLPGDPLHSVADYSHPYALRYVLQSGRFTPQR